MERQKTANYEMLNDFIEKHMQVNQRYNVNVRTKAIVRLCTHLAHCAYRS